MSREGGPGHRETLLVADIGATNARFAAAARGVLGERRVNLRTADYPDVEALLEHALAELAGAVPAAFGLAIAGPVDAGCGRITNGHLAFDAATLSRRWHVPVRVFNDFHAVARSLPDLRHLTQIGGESAAAGVKAVLGPGSGLGMAMLAPVAGAWHVLASEGGHADLAPGNPLEVEVLGALQAQHGHVAWETALSGPGLVRLYGAVCQVWGCAQESLSAEQISAAGVDAGDPVCHQTLELFFALLGAAAGNLAVTAYAEGGVYLGGGILPALAEFAAGSPLRRRFDERGPLSAWVRRVPLYLILDPAPGLTGALACLDDALAGG